MAIQKDVFLDYNNYNYLCYHYYSMIINFISFLNYHDSIFIFIIVSNGRSLKEKVRHKHMIIEFIS